MYCSRRTLPVMHPQVNGGYHDALRTYPGHVGGELHPGIMPGHVDQLGVAVHLGVRGISGGRSGDLPVIVPGPDRDPQRYADRHPARVDELGEVLAGQIGAERVRRGRARPRPARPCRSPGTPARQSELTDSERHAHDPMPAQRGALCRHPADRRVPGLVQRLDHRADAKSALAGHPRERPGRTGVRYWTSRPRSRRRRHSRCCTRTPRTPGRPARSQPRGSPRTRQRTASTPRYRRPGSEPADPAPPAAAQHPGRRQSPHAPSGRGTPILPFSGGRAG